MIKGNQQKIGVLLCFVSISGNKKGKGSGFQFTFVPLLAAGSYLGGYQGGGLFCFSFSEPFTQL